MKPVCRLLHALSLTSKQEQCKIGCCAIIAYLQPYRFVMSADTVQPSKPAYISIPLPNFDSQTCCLSSASLFACYPGTYPTNSQPNFLPGIWPWLSLVSPNSNFSIPENGPPKPFPKSRHYVRSQASSSLTKALKKALDSGNKAGSDMNSSLIGQFVDVPVSKLF
jgi:hypothetical protein